MKVTYILTDENFIPNFNDINKNNFDSWICEHAKKQEIEYLKTLINKEIKYFISYQVHSEGYQKFYFYFINQGDVYKYSILKCPGEENSYYVQDKSAQVLKKDSDAFDNIFDENNLSIDIKPEHKANIISIINSFINHKILQENFLCKINDTSKEIIASINTEIQNKNDSLSNKSLPRFSVDNQPKRIIYKCNDISYEKTLSAEDNSILITTLFFGIINEHIDSLAIKIETIANLDFSQVQEIYIFIIKTILSTTSNELQSCIQQHIYSIIENYSNITVSQNEINEIVDEAKKIKHCLLSENIVIHYQHIKKLHNFFIIYIIAYQWEMLFSLLEKILDNNPQKENILTSIRSKLVNLDDNTQKTLKEYIQTETKNFVILGTMPSISSNEYEQIRHLASSLIYRLIIEEDFIIDNVNLHLIWNVLFYQKISYESFFSNKDLNEFQEFVKTLSEEVINILYLNAITQKQLDNLYKNITEKFLIPEIFIETLLIESLKILNTKNNLTVANFFELLSTVFNFQYKYYTLLLDIHNKYDLTQILHDKNKILNIAVIYDLYEVINIVVKNYEISMDNIHIILKALFLCIEKNYDNLLQILLAKFFNKNNVSNIYNDKGETLLMVAAFYNRHNIVEQLLNLGADINFFQINTIGNVCYDALGFAIHGSSIESTKKILQHGLNITNFSYGFKYAAELGHENIIQIFLEYITENNISDNPIILNLISQASLIAIGFNQENIFYMLLSRFKDINFTYFKGYNALELSLLNSNERLAKVLLKEYKKQINLLTNNYPLNLSILHKCYNIFDMLINDNEFNLSKDDLFNTIFTLAKQNNKSLFAKLVNHLTNKYKAEDNVIQNVLNRSMLIAFENNNKEIFFYILEQKADLNFRDENDVNILTIYAQNNNLNDYEQLIETSLNKGVIKYDFNYLIIAAINNNVSACMFFITYLQKTNKCDISEINKVFLTACLRASNDVVEFLLNNFAQIINVNTTDDEGNTVFSNSALMMKNDLIQRLLSLGAKLGENGGELNNSILDNNLDLVKIFYSLLEEKYANNKVKLQDIIDQALLLAVHNDEIFNFLLTKNANVNVKIFKGYTLLTKAILLDKSELILTLLQSNVNLSDNHQELIQAVNLGKIKYIELILDYIKKNNADYYKEILNDILLKSCPSIEQEKIYDIFFKEIGYENIADYYELLLSAINHSNGYLIYRLITSNKLLITSKYVDVIVDAAINSESIEIVTLIIYYIQQQNFSINISRAMLVAVEHLNAEIVGFFLSLGAHIDDEIHGKSAINILFKKIDITNKTFYANKLLRLLCMDIMQQNNIVVEFISNDDATIKSLNIELLYYFVLDKIFSLHKNYIDNCNSVSKLCFANVNNQDIINIFFQVTLHLAVKQGNIYIIKKLINEKNFNISQILHREDKLLQQLIDTIYNQGIEQINSDDEKLFNHLLIENENKQNYLNQLIDLATNDKVTCRIINIYCTSNVNGDYSLNNKVDIIIEAAKVNDVDIIHCTLSNELRMYILQCKDLFSIDILKEIDNRCSKFAQEKIFIYRILIRVLLTRYQEHINNKSIEIYKQIIKNILNQNLEPHEILSRLRSAEGYDNILLTPFGFIDEAKFPSLSLCLAMNNPEYKLINDINKIVQKIEDINKQQKATAIKMKRK